MVGSIFNASDVTCFIALVCSCIIHVLFEKPNLGRYILALKLFEYYHHHRMQENWIDFFKATKSVGRQEMGGEKMSNSSKQD